MRLTRRVWPSSYRGRIAWTIALAIVIVLATQGVIRGIVNDRIRSAAQETLQQQASAIAQEVDAAQAAVKGDTASDANRYLPDTRMTVTWDAPGGFYYNLVPLPDLDIRATARSGDVEVELERASASGGVADWLVVALFLAGLGVAAVLVWGLAGAVARRLRVQAADLAASAEAVASGDLTVRAQVPDDELGRAAAAFNRMTERLADAEGRQRRFLADVSHELRTPVTAIDGFATALVDGAAATPDAREEAVAFIREEARRLRELIDDLRELTWLDLDPPTEAADVDLAEAAREAIRRFAPAAERSGVTLVGPSESAIVRSDARHVATILANLIGNALAATPPGGRITVTAGTAGDGAWFSVTDTGIGIAAAHLARIFDRLYRVDTARARGDTGGGSGLGLAIVKQLVEQVLGGAVRVQSAPGDGTTFTVTLPPLAARQPT